MLYIIGLLTVIMVLDCIVLMGLVLIQLPKKEAGAGLAFGGSATDALFGAGSGNVLTKITKYSAGIFFILAVVLSVLQRTYSTRPGSEFQRRLEQATQAPAPAPATTPAATPSPTAPGAGMTLPLTPTNLMSAPSAATNGPAEAPATNLPAEPKSQ